MKPPPFRYYDPRSTAEAVDLVGRLDNAKLLAGGQSLMPMLNMRFVLPDHVIDLNRIDELAFVREEPEKIVVGAMTRQRELEFSPVVTAGIPLVQAALEHVGHRQTRNRGTIGGSLCHLDPAAELVTVAIALDATLTLQGPNGARTLPMAEFPLGFMTPALEFDEILTSIAFPKQPPGHGFAFAEFARRHGDFAIASAAALIELDRAGRIARATLVLGGVGVVPVRMESLEGELVGALPSEALFEKACRLCGEVDALDDALVSAEYRKRIAPVMARRALVQAAERANSLH